MNILNGLIHTTQWLFVYALFLLFSLASVSTAATTNQVVLFTGFLATPGTGTGMDILNSELANSEIPNYAGQVFAWNDRESAFDWVQQLQSDRLSLVLIGHSFGGNAALQLASEYLGLAGVDVDLTVQIDPVANGGSGRNDVLPVNVDVGFNYYQISQGFFEPQGEDFVLGATNINTEILFNDASISHTSIDNDPRLHSLIGQNILDNLNYEDADFNSDGFVAGSDYLTWQEGFGTVGTATLSEGDANGDNNVDAADLELWHQQYGSESSSPVFHVATVPEPSTVWLLAIGSLVRISSTISHRRKLAS